MVPVFHPKKYGLQKFAVPRWVRCAGATGAKAGPSVTTALHLGQKALGDWVKENAALPQEPKKWNMVEPNLKPMAKGNRLFSLHSLG